MDTKRELRWNSVTIALKERMKQVSAGRTVLGPACDYDHFYDTNQVNEMDVVQGVGPLQLIVLKSA